MTNKFGQTVSTVLCNDQFNLNIEAKKKIERKINTLKGRK
jgi:hypothetical protein